jgi:hypothetical protein
MSRTNWGFKDKAVAQKLKALATETVTDTSRSFTRIYGDSILVKTTSGVIPAASAEAPTSSVCTFYYLQDGAYHVYQLPNGSSAVLTCYHIDTRVDIKANVYVPAIWVGGVPILLPGLGAVNNLCEIIQEDCDWCNWICKNCEGYAEPDGPCEVPCGTCTYRWTDGAWVLDGDGECTPGCECALPEADGPAEGALEVTACVIVDPPPCGKCEWQWTGAEWVVYSASGCRPDCNCLSPPGQPGGQTGDIKSEPCTDGCGSCSYRWTVDVTSGTGVWVLVTSNCGEGCVCGPAPATDGAADGETAIAVCIEGCGNCYWTWDAANLAWLYYTDDCTGSCVCDAEPDWSGMFQGQEAVTNCEEDLTIECCLECPEGYGWRASSLAMWGTLIGNGITATSNMAFYGVLQPPVAERSCCQTGTVRLYEMPFGWNSPGYEGPPPTEIFVPATVCLSGGVYSVSVSGNMPITGLNPSVSFTGPGFCLSASMNAPEMVGGSIWDGSTNVGLSIVGTNCIEVRTAELFRKLNPDLREACGSCGFKDAMRLLETWRDAITSSRKRLIVKQLRRATRKLTTPPPDSYLEAALDRTIEALRQ